MGNLLSRRAAVASPKQLAGAVRPSAARGGPRPDGGPPETHDPTAISTRPEYQKTLQLASQVIASRPLHPGQEGAATGPSYAVLRRLGNAPQKGAGKLLSSPSSAFSSPAASAGKLTHHELWSLAQVSADESALAKLAAQWQATKPASQQLTADELKMVLSLVAAYDTVQLPSGLSLVFDGPIDPDTRRAAEIVARRDARRHTEGSSDHLVRSRA